MLSTSDRTSEIAKLTNQLLSDESDSFKSRFINMLANLTVSEWKLLENTTKKLATITISEDKNGQLTMNLEEYNQKELSKSTAELEEEYKKSLSSSARNEVFTALNTTNENKKITQKAL